MRLPARIVAVAATTVLPVAAEANEACSALGHLALAADLMRVSSDTNMDLATGYGPSIEASLLATASAVLELRPAQPRAADQLQTLRRNALDAVAAKATGRLPASEFAATADTLGREIRQLQTAWQCQDVDGETNETAQTTDEAVTPRQGRRELSASGLATLRVAFSRINRENRIERAALLGCATTSAILLPYLLIRDLRRKRRAMRYVFVSSTIVEAEGERLAARFFDVSVSGAKLMVPRRLPPQTAIKLELGGASRPATVARSGKGFAGVSFDEPLAEEELRALLASDGEKAA
ncbi:MAG: PilZ domain-containing protein [Pseudomonadota bacterium]